MGEAGGSDERSRSRTFVDTNVLVYAVDDGEPAKRDRAHELLASEFESIVISAQVLSEFYVIVTRKLSHPLAPQDARAALEQLSKLPTVTVDATLVLAAVTIRDEARLSYWDSLIIAAARAAGCERLLTEDLSDGQVIAGVEVVDPFPLANFDVTRDVNGTPEQVEEERKKPDRRAR